MILKKLGLGLFGLVGVNVGLELRSSRRSEFIYNTYRNAESRKTFSFVIHDGFSTGNFIIKDFVYRSINCTKSQ